MLIKIAHWMRRLYYFIVRPITLGVRILLIDGDRVILVKHSYEPGWFLPGGGVKRGETLEQAARRPQGGRSALQRCGISVMEDLPCSDYMAGHTQGLGRRQQDHFTRRRMPRYLEHRIRGAR